MQRIVMKSLFSVTFLLLLTGCTNKSLTADNVLTLVEKEHDTIKSVLIEQEQIEYLDKDLSYTAKEAHDFENGVYLNELEDGLIQIYNDEDGPLFVVQGEEIDSSQQGYDVQKFKLDYEMKSQRNPFKQLKEFEEDVYSQFTIDERGGDYLIVYTGTDEQKNKLVKGIVWSSHIQAHDLAASSEELDLSNIDLKITAKSNKETNRIKSFDMYIKYETPSQFNTRNVEYMTKNLYTAYNEVGEIEKPSVEASQAMENIGSLSDAEIEIHEKEAGQYVDALIQATVFQNVEKYTSLAPGKVSEEEKREEGERQQFFFRQIYEENTMANMKDAGVTQEEVVAYTDAFLKAMSKTDYEIVGSEMQNDGTIQVIVAIQGIDDSKLNYEVGKQLEQEYKSGKVKEENLVSRNIELIIEAYEKNEDILPPLEAIVDVHMNDDGTYFVLFQDQYLMNFVQ